MNFYASNRFHRQGNCVDEVEVVMHAVRFLPLQMPPLDFKLKLQQLSAISGLFIKVLPYRLFVLSASSLIQLLPTAPLPLQLRPEGGSFTPAFLTRRLKKCFARCITSTVMYRLYSDYLLLCRTIPLGSGSQVKDIQYRCIQYEYNSYCTCYIPVSIQC